MGLTSTTIIFICLGAILCDVAWLWLYNALLFAKKMYGDKNIYQQRRFLYLHKNETILKVAENELFFGIARVGSFLVGYEYFVNGIGNRAIHGSVMIVQVSLLVLAIGEYVFLRQRKAIINFAVNWIQFRNKYWWVTTGEEFLSYICMLYLGGVILWQGFSGFA